MALAHTLTDNFNDNSIDTGKWDDYVINSATIAESSGMVICTPANSTADSEAGFNSLTTYNLRDSYVFIQLVQAADVASCYSVLKIELDANNYVLFGVKPTNSFFVDKTVAASTTAVASTTYDSAKHKWMRIRESNGFLYFEYSTDGSQWIAFGSAANPFAITALTLAFDVYELNSDASPGAAHFDNFNILQTELTDPVQGIFGEFKPVGDISEGTFTANQVQGVFGEFKPVIDDSQGAAVGGTAIKDLIGGGFILFPR